MAKNSSRISPSHENFPGGLEDRNVFLYETGNPDPYTHETRRLTPARIEETEAESESHGQLWALDQAKIDRGSNKALFQRTLIMKLIGRHLFVYHRHNVK